MIESELVPLAGAIPAEKCNITPTHGEFATVGTFGQQVRHAAVVLLPAKTGS